MAVLGVVDGRGQHLGQAHGAEALQKRDPSPEEARDDARVDAFVQLVGGEIGRIERQRSGAGGPQRVHAVGDAIVEGHEPVPGHPRHLGPHHVQGGESRDGGIGGVASGHEHAQTRHGCQRMSGRHQPVGPGDRGPVRRAVEVPGQAPVLSCRTVHKNEERRGE